MKLKPCRINGSTNVFIHVLRSSGLIVCLTLVAGLGSVGRCEAESAQVFATKSALASRALLTASARAGQRIIAVGAFGNIVYSDNGEEWRQADSVPTQTLLTTVTFLDDKEGWAAGHDSLILHTIDGGRNWEIVYEDLIPDGDVPKPILDLHFSDRLHGIAVGAFSLLLITQDGGKHWAPVDTEALRGMLENAGLEPEPNFNAITPLDDGFLIVGELGTLIHYRPNGQSTEDPDSHWRILQSPYAGSFFGAATLASHELLVYGLRGHCYRSEDSGTTWSAISTGTTANIYDALDVGDGNIIAVGAGGTILQVRHGRSDADILPYDGFNGFVSVQNKGGGQLLLFGDAGAESFNLP